MCVSDYLSAIVKGMALDEAEVDFIVALIMGWIERQVKE